MNNTQEINGQVYDIGTMNAFKQFHVARRLAPVILEMFDSVGSNATQAPDPTAMFKSIVKALALLSDADCDFIITTCLGVVKRKSGDGWQAVMLSGGSLLFQDIDLPTMLQITAAVVQSNLGSFIPALQVPGL